MCWADEFYLAFLKLQWCEIPVYSLRFLEETAALISNSFRFERPTRKQHSFEAQKKHAELLIHLASDFGQIVAIDLSISTASSGVYQSLRCALAGEQQLRISSRDWNSCNLPKKKVPSKKHRNSGSRSKVAATNLSLQCNFMEFSSNMF